MRNVATWHLAIRCDQTFIALDPSSSQRVANVPPQADITGSIRLPSRRGREWRAEPVIGAQRGKVKEQYRGRWLFRLDRMASWPEREGPGVAYAPRLMGAGPPISRVDSRVRFLRTFLCTIWASVLGGRLPLESLLWGREPTGATYRRIQMHRFRKQLPIVRTTVGFVVIATVLCLFFGPTGILYALGFEVLYLLTIAFAAILDPDVY
jgi:hypothetical protein